MASSRNCGCQGGELVRQMMRMKCPACGTVVKAGWKGMECPKCGETMREFGRRWIRKSKEREVKRWPKCR